MLHQSLEGKAYREGFYEEAARAGISKEALANTVLPEVDICSIRSPEFDVRLASFAGGMANSGIEKEAFISTLANWLPYIAIGLPVGGLGVGSVMSLLKRRYIRRHSEPAKAQKLVRKAIKELEREDTEAKQLPKYPPGSMEEVLGR